MTMISLICEISNMTQMNLSVKQKQTHRHRRQMYGYQTGKWGDDRQARSLGLADIKITT